MRDILKKYPIKLCIDPGVHGIAYALGVGGTMTDCGYIRTGKDLTSSAACARNVVGRILWSVETHEPARCVLVERPVYEKHRNISHQNVMDLSIIAGACASFPNTVLVEPSKWKGSVPKEIHQPRITGSLTHEETLILYKNRTGNKELDHNIIDAIGILLWTEKRLRR